MTKQKEDLLSYVETLSLTENQKETLQNLIEDALDTEFDIGKDAGYEECKEGDF